jgi:hypothetical protein
VHGARFNISIAEVSLDRLLASCDVAAVTWAPLDSRVTAFRDVLCYAYTAAMSLPPSIEFLLSEVPNGSSPDDARQLFSDKAFIRDLLDQVSHTLQVCTYELDKEFGDAFVTYAAGGLSPLAPRGRCHHIECNLKHASAFARTAGLYSDRVIITDALTHDLFFDTLDGRRVSPLVDQYFTDIQVLHQLRPLLDADVIELGASGYLLCAAHMDQVHTAERSVARALHARLSNEGFSMDVIKRRDRMIARINYVALCALGEREHHFEVAVPAQMVKRWRKIRHARPGSRAHTEVLDVVRRATREPMTQFVKDLLFETRVAALSRSTILTDSALAAWGLQSLEGLSLTGSTAWESVRTIDLPWLKRLSPAELLEVRDQTAEALPTFRSHLRNTLFAGPKTPESIHSAISDLRDAALALESRLQRVSVKRLRRATAVTTAGAVALVVYGFGSRDLNAAISAAGGALGALTSVLASAHAANKEHGEIVQKPAYVLLKAKQGLRHRRGRHRPQYRRSPDFVSN